MTSNCIFCNQVAPLLENELALAFFDQSPVSLGHLLIIPKVHRQDYFDCNKEELAAINDLTRQAKLYLEEQFSPDGYNIGWNCGQVAGQTIFHCHMHLIPRYQGDVENPIGGVRGVIPNKQNYKKKTQT